MNTPRLPRCLAWWSMVFAALAPMVVLLAADTSSAPVDWNRAQELRRRAQQGEALNAEDQAYLDRAQAAARKGGGPNAAILAQLSPGEREQVRAMMEKRRNGEPFTDSDRALEQKVRGLMAQTRKGPPSPTASVPGARESTGMIPLTEMTAGQTYKGRDGGLYGGGRNEPPPVHAEAARRAAGEIVPLGTDGKPARDGKIVLLSVGMSNTTQEFSRFVELADRDPQKSPDVVLVDGAQGGKTAAAWAQADDSAIWRTVDQRLRAAHVTPAQVEVVWLKQANARPTEPFPTHAEKLTSDLSTLVRQLKAKFPNLRIAYLSSRIYAGYATTPLNPEPYAYESAFAVRDLILRQIGGEPALNFDPAKGAVKAPLLLWGPYLWADGLTPRKSDGLVWKREDLREDGTHPSVTSGREKVAQMLLAFLKSDPTARVWFTRAAVTKK